MNLDQSLSVKLFYLAAASPGLSALSWFCASVLIFILLAAAVLWLGWPKFYEQRNQLLELLLAAVGSWSLAQVLQQLFDRTRPYLSLAETPLVDLWYHTPSFPSGHATLAFATATIIFLHHRKIGVWFLLAAALVALGRVLVGVHYLGDILAGALLGFAVSLGIHFLFKKNLLKIK